MSKTNSPSDAYATDEATPFEDALSRIPGIMGVRVAGGDDGPVREVHVLAGTDRSAKQLVRDVQSVLSVQFGLEIDYRIVSVVQLGGEESAPASAAAADPGTQVKRPIVKSITTEILGHTVAVNVQLSLGEETAQGSAKGSAHSAPRLVARATVEALSSILPGLAPEVDYAEIVKTSSMDVALVVLRVMSARTELVLTGSAGAPRDANDAIARATLAALNRTLGG